MGAIGQQRHGVIGQAAGDLHAHEHGGDNRRPFGLGFGAGVTLAQKDVVTGPHTMIVRLFGLMAVVMPMMVVVMTVRVIVAMVMGMTVRMPFVGVLVMGMIVRHGASLACCRCKIS